MGYERFTESEAKDKIDRSIRSLVEFSGVPKGTVGKVVQIDELAGGYDIVVEWFLPGRGKPLRDWFSKDEFEKYLIEE
jgi:hypothetical protein